MKVATTIAVTNTVVWEKTSEGTREVFTNENEAQSRYYDRMASACAAQPCISESDRKKLRRKLSEEYYDKDEK